MTAPPRRAAQWDWSRPYWQPTGRDASVYYFIAGEPPGDTLRISRLPRFADAFRRGLRLSVHERRDDPVWFGRFFHQEGLGHDLPKVFGDHVVDVRAAERGILVQGEFEDPRDLGYLRDAVRVVSAIVEQGAQGVMDMFAGCWWSGERWLRRFADGGPFAIQDHIQFVVTDDAVQHPGLWAHTRGMRKFGRPDLQTKHVSGLYTAQNRLIRAAGRLFYTVGDYLARGSQILDRQVMEFPGRQTACTFLYTNDDSGEQSPYFCNSVLEIVDLVDQKSSIDLRRLLKELAIG
jgi:hypothetical protein